jgi:hypothetical protein
MRIRDGALGLLSLSLAAGCGARSGLGTRNRATDSAADVPDTVEARDAIDAMDAMDAGDAMDVTDVTDARDAGDAMDVTDVTDARDAADVRDVADGGDACVPVEDNCGAFERCDNGLDDDCDGEVDEGCACTPGMVQRCFAGPPGRRNVGVCQDGAQVCIGDGQWGPCIGGVVPQPDTCNGADNACNGCSQQRDCPILCPEPDDPRVPVGAPFRDYPLRGTDFYRGPAAAWQWRVEGGPCDRISSRLRSFELRGERTSAATFVPRLSGDYTVTLSVTTPAGITLSCAWIVRVEGPGLRVEMCYPESETSDLDLFLHRPNDRTPWYGTPSDVFQPTGAVCGWHNCEANIRGMSPLSGAPVPRADWGYGTSALAECENGPQGDTWRMLGSCANPRLDIDNNLSEGIGVPENINVDRPRDGESFRIMVQNFSGTLARPLVNVYCAGRRVATLGAAPDEVPAFEAARMGNADVGAMWRVADVRTTVDGAGRTRCAVTPLHPPGSTRGYWITLRDPSF